jgi:hypothetical protein
LRDSRVKTPIHLDGRARVGDNAAMQIEPSKAESPKCKRRWFQFSLRTLLIAVSMLALPLGYVGWQAKIVRERGAFLENRYYLPGESCPFEPVQAPWMLRLLGAKPIYHVTVWGRAEVERAASLFPEAIVADMEGVEQHPLPSGPPPMAP